MNAVAYEGGTVREVDWRTSSRKGWGLSIMEWTTYRGEVCFFVARNNGRHFLKISPVFMTVDGARLSFEWKSRS